MGIIELLLIGASLAMDATAVSICKGLSMKKLSKKQVVIIALYFGTFQALMPTIGYALGVSFKDFVESIDHWIAFTLLLVIGINMILETLKNNSETSKNKTKEREKMLTKQKKTLKKLIKNKRLEKQKKQTKKKLN